MTRKNSVYIATSLDGYIADKNGNIDWLDSIPIPEGEDMGYVAFMENIDALVMGRTTFETVVGFDVEWPYQKPVFVLSNSLKSIPDSHHGKAHLVKGTPGEILEHIHSKGCLNLYMDGGLTIKSFLEEDLIDELVITVFPLLLGGGSPLFHNLPRRLNFELVESHIYAEQLVQNRYRRSKK